MVAATTLIDSGGETFERLFAEEYRRVVSIAYRITRDSDEAEDVAQEVFARCGRRRATGVDGARRWLYTAAVHAALNAVRSRRRRAHRELRDYRLSAAPGAAADLDPQRITERHDDRARVRAALARLNPRDAELLALRYGGLSYREIAFALCIDAAQVGTRLARAERAFKREMERDTSG
jgi:RNA polymerase sigma factor (sigma-70 family)